MPSIITIILLCAGVIALRKNKDKLGYALIVVGWLVAVIADILISTSWDRGFMPALFGIVFVWLVQDRMTKHRKNIK